MKTYYKVVRDKLQSAFIDGKWQVRYKLNEWVSAPLLLADRGYGLTVFKSQADARYFIHLERGEKRLFACRIQTPMELSSFHIVLIVNGDLPPYSDPPYRKSWPPGTVMCKKVKLVKEITP